MNILPHKSWHVRTKKNIDRVNRDEAKAAEEEKEKQRKIALAEQEARTDILRRRGKERLGGIEFTLPVSNQTPEDTTAIVASDKTEHINFFSDIEQGLRKEGKNKEHEAEKKAEKEKWEKSIGLLTYLGKSSIDEQNEVPWYLKKSKKKEKEEEQVQTLRFDMEYKRKSLMDPLNDMKQYMEKKKKHKHKEKKHKHKSKSQDVEKSDPSLPRPTTGKTMEQLRAERRRREQEERQRTEALLAKLRGDVPEEVKEQPVPERQRKYNSQYNPDFVRQPKKKRDYPFD
ncbi:leukocyte receptor cluster member 1 homolog [Gigantopelta aegis]|uniref:leukocyte receptor cluster member 1 homolog n=1 Tax=Gigantopelta aegis TaxID=1735272 RepID=UPI001B887E9D|nr:leukocyte receptor cluster member 1 homolog [Gigantopelta aegis]XP_041348014.1 leukocyte receptor cluster member 1 homolog [Gigantopelta aegis]